MRNVQIKRKLKTFGKSKDGNVFMITALLLPVLISAGGIAVDVTRAFNVRSEMINSLDAAVLAAGNELSRGMPVDGKFRKNFDNFFFANIEGRGGLSDDFKITKFKADPKTGQVTAEAKAKIDTTMMRIAGYSELEMTAESSATFSTDDIEVAIMLDTTGSMKGQKLADLKAAARDIIEALLPSRNTLGVRIALVPYSGSVNVGKYRATVTSGNVRLASANGILSPIDAHGARNTCVTERGGNQAETDASYRVARVGSDKRTEDPSFSCPARAQVQPLTNNKGVLFDTLGKLDASGFTAGHLGVAWSYYTLSENWRDLWPAASDPAPYRSPTRKIAILMTDGEFNTFYNGTTVSNDPHSAYGSSTTTDNVAKSNDLAIDICDHMKQPKGGGTAIKVYSIAFQAPASAEKTLRNCATPDSADEKHYFSADNGKELRDAFREIARNIQRLRISQ